MRIDRAIRIRRTTSLTALVDVVFLLLLFFMLASTFSRFSVIEVGLGGSGRPAAETSLDTILLSVDAEGSLFVNGSAVEPGTLAEVLRGSGDARSQRILLRPTSRATAQDIVSALELARAAAAGDVILVR
ncbi:biopolymer transporter ExbD [Microbaculum marinum]|uniref:Biopolymer transporter ExbD n=1 Tax=Microbaculum marinum TaxID=1764581 RepID=A0AAW9RKY3_9HYPH